MKTAHAEYIDTAEQAKLIRQALKREFPGIKFSVRISRYSGGSSVDVEWTDGPTEDQVRTLTDGYRGGGFDGMIDMAYSVETWLLPDGSVRFAGTPGTEGSKGTVPAAVGSPMHPGARLVQFLGDHVMTHRNLSPEFKARCLEKVRETLGHPVELEDHVPDFWYRGRSFPYPSPSGHDMVAFVARRTATKGSDWIPEWKRPKPKKAPEPRKVFAFMHETPNTFGNLSGGIWTHGRRGRGIGSAYYFTYVPETKTVHFRDWKAPKYVRAAAQELLSWGTGEAVTVT